MHEQLERLLQTILKKKIPMDITVPDRKEFGHYSTAVALRLAKAEQKNPMLVAGEIARSVSWNKLGSIVEKVEVAPPGFINIWIKKEVLQKELRQIIKQKADLARSKVGKGKKVIVEYLSLNIAKDMHAGHLRNLAIGDTLARSYDALGYKVIRWNYLGDWGTQFGKVIAAYKRWGNKKEIEKDPMRSLLGLYVRFSKESKENPVLTDEARAEFRKLEQGDKENRKLWEWFRKESLRACNAMCKRLGITFDVSIGESFFEKDLPGIVKELVKKGLAVRSEGALIVPLEQFNLPPAMAQKTDGGSLYLTRDLANIRYRIKKYKPSKILYVVGNEQTLQLEQTFRTAQLMGLYDKQELKHIKYGLVLGETGRKFSTREGEAVFAMDIVSEAITRALKVVEEKRPELSGKEKKEIAEMVGIGALKYANLHENRNSDLTFNWDAMLSFTGDSGPYLQYTHARLRNILRKSGLKGRATMKFLKGDIEELAEEHELALVRKMIELPYVVQQAAHTYAPNLVTLYLYELATQANHFYEVTPILKDANATRRNGRLLLVQAVAQTLKTGLGLLGIEAPEKI